MAQNTVDFSKPLMPEGTASWLIENTGLTFRQIARFCGLHEAEVERIANDEKASRGNNPVHEGLVTADDIKACEANPSRDLSIIVRRDLPSIAQRSRGPRYTPVAKRSEKPDAIAYLLKYHAEIRDSQICKLIGTTKPTIQSIRDKTHPTFSALRPRNPADLGLCTYQELERVSHKALRALGRDPEAEAAQRIADAESASQAEQADATKATSGFDFSNFLKGTGTKGA